jgi:D-3-phosphoglycerate dehydrogenase / 2-oxoglutarate reductase
VPRALITCLHLQRDFERYRPQYEAHDVEPILPEIRGQQLAAAEMVELIEDVDAVIAGDDVIDATVLERGAGSRLKAIVKWGVGTDGIDKEAAKRLDLPVYNTPGMFAGEVADLALSHLLLIARRTHEMHASVLYGGWRQVQGHSLAGKTAGVIGLGAIGSAIARRAAAFGMEVLGYDIRAVGEEEHGVVGMRQLGLWEVLTEADVVFVACQLTPENHHLLSREAFARMREGATVINVSRGPLIDQEALVEALRSGRIAAAGLDVFEREPLPADDPLREFADRCTFSTHNGSNTVEAVARTNQRATDILLRVLGLRETPGLEPNRVA